MNTVFWKNKRVLITGHNGFKGTWLTKWLDMTGAQVLGISLAPDMESGFGNLSFGRGYKNLNADVREVDFYRSVYEFQPEIAIHLAAQAIVKTAKENPVETFRTNVIGTVNVLECLRNGDSIKAIIVITSDKVYENRETMVPYRESDALMGSEPYSCSKVAQEQVAKAYFDTYFKETEVGLATARASNTFGGGDFHFDRLVPYLERCAFEGAVSQIRNPNSVRPWQYVLDILNGYLMLAEHLYERPNRYMEYYNFGPDRSELYTVGQIADIICENFHAVPERQNFFEAGLLLLESGKSQNELGWRPTYNVKDGLLETNEAYREYFAHGCSDRMYEERIEAYMKNLRNRA